jgi:hypothetical protein
MCWIRFIIAAALLVEKYIYLYWPYAHKTREVLMVYDVYLHISLITQLSNWNTTIDNYLIHVLWENDE